MRIIHRRFIRCVDDNIVLIDSRIQARLEAFPNLVLRSDDSKGHLNCLFLSDLFMLGVPISNFTMNLSSIVGFSKNRRK